MSEPSQDRIRIHLERSVGWGETLLQDLRYGLRGLARTPLFALTAVLTLALTTGAMATVLSLADGLFLRRLPVEDAGRLLEVAATRRQGTVRGLVSYPDYALFRDRNATLSGLAAHYSTAPLMLALGDRAEELTGAVVSANFFPLLGVRPELGRFFLPEEDSVPGRDRVAVLSHELWRGRFAAAPGILGSSLELNGVAFTVVGVAPRGFGGVTASPSQVYLPLMMLGTGYRWCDDALAADCTILRMIGRLAPGRSLGETRAEMATLVPTGWRDAPEGENTGLAVASLRGALRDPEEARLVALLGLVAALLLAVGCANLAGLLLARGSARGRELAVRASLGAGKRRLVRQLMTESLLLAVGGGASGLFLSLALTRALASRFYAFDSGGRPLQLDFRPEPAVLLALAGVWLVAALLFGWLPARRSIRLGLGTGLRSGSGAVTGRSRLGRGLAGVQAAAAVALVATAGMVVASSRTLAAGTTFEPSRVVLLRLRPRLLGYPPARAQDLVAGVLRRLAETPGVESASMVGTGAVLQGLATEVAPPEWAADGHAALAAGYLEVGPRYFETLRVPLLRGRELEDADRTGSPPVAVVNRTLARRLWPGESGLGRRLLVGGRPHEVVGVVDDLPLTSRAEGPRAYVYTPYWQNAEQVDARLCVRVKGDPAEELPRLVRVVLEEDPWLPVTETMTLPLQMASHFRPQRITATFLGYAAGLALLLSALGLYGTLAFSISRRTREIGIRRAVGAEPGTVVGMVLGEGVRVVLPGVVSGLVLAVAGTRLISHYLYGSVTDLAFYAAAGLLVAAVGLVACWLPARRAAKVEPMAALRAE